MSTDRCVNLKNYFSTTKYVNFVQFYQKSSFQPFQILDTFHLKDPSVQIRRDFSNLNCYQFKYRCVHRTAIDSRKNLNITWNTYSYTSYILRGANVWDGFGLWRALNRLCSFFLFSWYVDWTGSKFYKPNQNKIKSF